MNLYYINVFINEYYPGIPRTESRAISYHLIGCNDTTLTINGLGLKEIMSPCWNIRPDGNKDFLAIIFYDDVEFYLNDKVIDNVKNKLLILSPGTKHSYGHNLNTWNHSWLHFSGKYVERLIEVLGIPVNKFLNIGNSEYFEKLITEIHMEIYYYSPPKLEIIKNELSNFFTRIERRLKLETVQEIPQDFQRIKQDLDILYSNKFTVSDLAKRLGYSVPYFCNKFKQYYHVSPIDYLINRRIELAKYFLESTNLQVSEISERVGYEDFYYFSKIFKKRAGVSPRNYRLGKN